MPRLTRSALTLCLVALGALSAVGVPAAAKTSNPLPPVSEVTALYPVSWSGQNWTARESPLAQQNPNNNYWLGTPDNVFTDSQGNLHLVLAKTAGKWEAVGLNTTKSDFGYGTYRFVMQTPMGSLDPMAVVGLFTFNNQVTPGRAENDVELSRWGQPDTTARNAQWVIQPWTKPGHLIPFNVPPKSPMTYQFTWKPSSVVFKAFKGTSSAGRLVNSWKSTKILPGLNQSGTQVHINLWLMEGQAPYNGKAQEVVLKSFSYSPLG